MKGHHGVNHHPHRGTRGHGRKISKSSKFTFQRTKNTTKFCGALSEAANDGGYHSCCVSEQNPHHMESCQMFMTQDGQTGFAVQSDGDIIGVFNSNKDKHGALNVIMPMAVEHGGDRLDCYGALATLYGKYGFVATGRSVYNSEYVDETDKKNDYLKEERPDVYAMMYVGGFREYELAELKSLPVMNYDDMLSDRDAKIAEMKMAEH